MEFDILLEYFFFFFKCLYPKSFVLCLKIVLQLEYMVLTAIYIVIPGYYRIHGNKCPFSL